MVADMSTALEEQFSELVDELVELAEARRKLPSPAARRHIRLAAGASLADVGAALGVSKQAVSLWEHGKGPSRNHVRTYVRVLEALKAAS